MFSLNSLNEYGDLQGTYASFPRDQVLLMPRTLEFLDAQEELISGVAYIASEQDAVRFFSTAEPRIFSGALLFLSEASDALPALPEQLLVAGWREPTGRLFNRTNAYISLGGETDAYRRFGAVWDELSQQSGLSNTEILDRLHVIPGLTGPFVQVGVVIFQPERREKVPLRLVLDKLMACFSASCGTVKGQELIFLITYEERRYDYPFDFEQITAILREYDGYLGLSNGTRDLSTLQVLHGVICRTVKLGIALGVAPERRIITMDRFGMYTAIDFCAQGFRMLTGSEAYLYLCHPAVVALRRHDVENHDNLTDVLYFYLSFDCSIARASERLHMHRNTVANKIERINSQFKLSLEDRHLRQRLLFSCQLLMYYETMNAPPSTQQT